MSSGLSERLEAIQREIARELEQAVDLAEIEAIRVRTLGRKGLLTAEAKAIGALAAEDRPAAGDLVNQFKSKLESAIA